MTKLSNAIATYSALVDPSLISLATRQGAMGALDQVLRADGRGRDSESGDDRGLSGPGGHGHNSSELDPLLVSLSQLPGGMAATELSCLPPLLRTMLLASAARLALDGSPSDQELLACAVVPAAFVGGQMCGASVDCLLAGIGVGLEVALFVAEALGEGRVPRGFDLIGTAGRLGASMAAAHVVGLDPSSALAALGFSSTMAAGFARTSSPLRALGAGKAAADGLEAATLAHEGLGGPDEPLEGRRGLFALVAPGVDVSSLSFDEQGPHRVTPGRDAPGGDEAVQRAISFSDYTLLRPALGAVFFP